MILLHKVMEEYLASVGDFPGNEYWGKRFEVAYNENETYTAELKSEVDKLKTKIREANIFIKWIAEMLNMNIDGIGYDEIKFGIDDFYEALKKYVEQKSI